MTKLSLNGFKKFTDKRKVAVDYPRITITKGGRINLNKIAYNKYFKDYSFVDFYFNPTQKIIAMKLLKNSTEYSYEVKKVPNSDIAAINSLGFFKHNKIDVSVKHETDILDFNEDEKIIFLKIRGL